MSDDEKPGVHERLLGAFEATDLSIDLERRTEADYLMALGMAEQRVGRASGAAMRLPLASTPSEYRASRESVVGLAKKLNAKRGWGHTPAIARRIGELALAHHAFPTCPACKGRGREVADGAPFLNSNLCKPCHGSGQRPVQRRHHDEIRAVIEALERIQALTEHHVRKILR